MQKRWKIIEIEEEKIQFLANELKISPVLCKLLVQRKIETYQQAKEFFRPSLQQLHDPWLMKDMDKAVARIQKAIQHNQKILVFGDYDVDGTTAVACMYQFLTSIYQSDKVEFYIPHRYREGYGVSKLGIDYAYENGFDLIISLDCGIKSVDLIEYASSLGVDFIVCDHHLPDEILPPAVAILNPKQPSCDYPYKELCGCGVGFKLICAIAGKIGLPPELPYQYLDLVATAIAADIVPMTGENRILAYFGLEKANINPNLGIKALKELSGFTKNFQITNLVFMIAPRVNAAGRMDDGKKAVEMFIAETAEQARAFAEMLHFDNADRKQADQLITEEALQLLQNDLMTPNRKSTVLFQSHWHKGVVGIVASRLMDHYYRPTIVLTQSGEYAAGSARSVVGFNVYEAIHQCKELLIGYGGHFYAAGMTLDITNVDAFKKKFEDVVSSTIPDHLLVPETIIDCEVRFSNLTQTFYKIIDQMEPFGPENLRPTFLAKRVQNTGYCKIVKEQHIRYSLVQDGIIFCGIGFNMADKFELLHRDYFVDIVFTLEENEWNDKKQLQLKIIDLAPSQ